VLVPMSFASSSRETVAQATPSGGAKGLSASSPAADDDGGRSWLFIALLVGGVLVAGGAGFGAYRMRLARTDRR
jgi:hypothetical protein